MKIVHPSLPLSPQNGASIVTVIVRMVSRPGIRMKIAPLSSQNGATMNLGLGTVCGFLSRKPSSSEWSRDPAFA